MITDIQKDTILIVEDETSLRNALRDQFTRKGFVVFEANDGETGLAMALMNHPRVILLDMMMPNMDGKTMLTLLRSTNEWGKQVPVILLTNLSADDKLTTMQKIVEDVTTAYLVKSNWSLNQIIEKARAMIAWHEGS